jgi:hypothetical protein
MKAEDVDVCMARLENLMLKEGLFLMEQEVGGMRTRFLGADGVGGCCFGDSGEWN